jgi:hypothetical protein
MKPITLPLLAGGAILWSMRFIRYFWQVFYIISGPIPASHYFSRSPAVAELFSASHFKIMLATRLVATKADNTISESTH